MNATNSAQAARVTTITEPPGATLLSRTGTTPGNPGATSIRVEADRSREADTNVLLRRHQRQAHPGASRRRIFRYVPYVIVQDGSAEPEYEAHCVSGDEDECGAGSGRHPDPAKVEEWQG